MPTQSDVRLYTLGMRLKQAMLVTRSVGNWRTTFDHAVVTQLMNAIDNLGSGTSLSDRALQDLNDLKKPCRAFLRNLLRSEDQYFLEDVYAVFNRQLQLTLNALRMNPTSPNNEAGRTWFELGLEIVDGWNDDVEEFDSADDDDIEEEDYELPPTTAGDRSNEDGTVLTEGVGGGDEDIVDQQAVPWNWTNKPCVDRLLEQAAIREDDLFPLHVIESAEAPWRDDGPFRWQSWSRFESGLIRLAATVDTTVDSPPLNNCSETPRRVELPAGQQRILEVLREAGRRLTGEEIRSALERKHGSASEGVNKQILAEMVRAGTLTGREKGKRKGYGLPE